MHEIISNSSRIIKKGGEGGVLKSVKVDSQSVGTGENEKRREKRKGKEKEKREEKGKREREREREREERGEEGASPRETRAMEPLSRCRCRESLVKRERAKDFQRKEGWGK